MNKKKTIVSAILALASLIAYLNIYASVTRLFLLWFFLVNFFITLFELYRLLVIKSDAFEELVYLSKKYNIARVAPVAKVLTCRDSVKLHKLQNKRLKSKSESYGYDAIYDDINYHVSLFNAIIISKNGDVTNKGDKECSEARIIKEHVHKLSELDNLYIELEADAHINGTQRIDDLIDSLKEMV